jgi:hypothetical protein
MFNRILLVTGLLMVMQSVFGAILLLLQKNLILPPVAQSWDKHLGLLPIGIIVIGLSFWLFKRSESR